MERIIGVGIGLIDYKIRSTTISKSNGISIKELVKSALDERTLSLYGSLQAGGMTPNILDAFVQNGSDYQTRLIASVGNDMLGAFYQRKTAPKLGSLDVIPDEKTGIIALVLDDAGSTIGRYVAYGASKKINISEEEAAENNALLITDLTLLAQPSTSSDIERLLPGLYRSGGQFAINLAGAYPRFGLREDIVSALSSFRKEPDLVFGNEAEYAFLLGISTQDLMRNINCVFPNSRLVVVTRGEMGATVRFEDQILSARPMTVPQEFVVDETGAGDCFEGTMLAYLYKKPYLRWQKQDVINSANTASFAAALLVQSPFSRLDYTEVREVSRFHDLNIHSKVFSTDASLHIVPALP